MSYLRSVETAIGYIERQMKEDGLNVSSVCENVGVSKWYFQRIFKGITGDSIGDYIRKRRLSLAACELVESERSIIDLAIDYGFESQEAFTRAFKSHFHSTPLQFRKNRDPKVFMHKFELTNDFLKHLEEKLVMEPVFTDIKEKKLVGLKAPFKGVFDENANNHDVIPKLWQELMSRHGEIANKVAGHTYGVVRCNKVEGEEQLEYMAAVEVRDFPSELPRGMTSFVFPQGKIAKFMHKGSPAGIDKTIKYIFGTWLPQTKNQLREGLELEIYPQNYNPNDLNSGFEYCLTLQ